MYCHYDEHHHNGNVLPFSVFEYKHDNHNDALVENGFFPSELIFVVMSKSTRSILEVYPCPDEQTRDHVDNMLSEKYPYLENGNNIEIFSCNLIMPIVHRYNHIINTPNYKDYISKQAYLAWERAGRPENSSDKFWHQAVEEHKTEWLGGNHNQM